MLEKKLPLSKLAEPVTIFPQILKNLRVSDKKKVLSSPIVAQAIEEAAGVLSGTGRVLVRPSGTEPVIRVLAEGEDNDLCLGCVTAILEALKEADLA